MSEVRFSIITPTCGRPTLWAALGSVQQQRGMFDEHIIVLDGHMPALYENLLNPTIKDWSWRVLPAPEGRRFGNPARDWGLRYALGTHIIYLDDDDQLVPGVLEQIRERVAAARTRPHMFRIEQKSSGIKLGDDHSLQPYTCCGSQLVAPNIKPPPEWDYSGEDHYAREVAVIQQVVARCGEPVWHDLYTHAVGPASCGARP